MRTKTLTKAKKQNWMPLNKVTPVKIIAKNIEGNRVVVSKTDSNRVVIS